MRLVRVPATERAQHSSDTASVAQPNMQEAQQATQFAHLRQLAIEQAEAGRFAEAQLLFRSAVEAASAGDPVCSHGRKVTGAASQGAVAAQELAGVHDMLAQCLMESALSAADRDSALQMLSEAAQYAQTAAVLQPQASTAYMLSCTCTPAASVYAGAGSRLVSGAPARLGYRQRETCGCCTARSGPLPS